MKRLSLLLLFVCLAAPVLALDDLMGLQGNVFNSTGSRITNGDVTVQIHTEEVGGAQVYAETFTGAINNGEYDVLLGNATTLDLDQDRLYWMEVLINGQDMNFSGHSRQVFQSSIGSYENLSVEGNITVSNTGFGIVFPDGTFQTTAAVAGGGSGGGLNGTSTPGRVAFFNSTNQVQGSNDLVWNQTNMQLGIGIGAINANATLHVFSNGNGRFATDQVDAYFGNQSAGVGIVQVGEMQVGVSNDGVIGSLNLSGIGLIRNKDSKNPIEFGFVDSANGIRFALPLSGNDSGTYNARSMIIAGPSVFDNNIINCSFWGFNKIDCRTGATGSDLGIQDDLQVKGSASVGGNFSANETLFVTDTGNVGIGTDTPEGVLSIKGTGVHTSMSGTAASLFNIQNTNGNTFFSGIDFYGNQGKRIASIMMEQTGGGSLLHFGTSNNFVNGVTNDALVIDPTGDVGIGTGTPAEPLHVVASSDKAVRFETDDSGDVVAILDNLNTGINADGMIIRIGPNSNPGANNDFIFFQDGDGTTLGTCQGDGAGGVTCPGSSDERFKTDIKSMGSVKSKFSLVSPIKYKGVGGSKEVIGFSAQDVNATFPECVSVGAERILDNGTEIGEKLFLSKDCLIVPMWKMIQEQQSSLDVLEARIAILEAK